MRFTWWHQRLRYETLEFPFSFLLLSYYIKNNTLIIPNWTGWQFTYGQRLDASIKEKRHRPTAYFLDTFNLFRKSSVSTFDINLPHYFRQQRKYSKSRERNVRTCLRILFVPLQETLLDAICLVYHYFSPGQRGLLLWYTNSIKDQIFTFYEAVAKVVQDYLPCYIIRFFKFSSSEVAAHD